MLFYTKQPLYTEATHNFCRPLKKDGAITNIKRCRDYKDSTSRFRKLMWLSKSRNVYNSIILAMYFMWN